jgi:hypothetical protein
MLAAEYAKTLVADLAHACLARADLRSRARGGGSHAAAPAGGAAKGRGAGRRGADSAAAAAAVVAVVAVADTSAYPLSRVVGDVEQVCSGPPPHPLVRPQFDPPTD